MIRVGIAALALLGTFAAGAAAMAWYLTRWHDDREPLQAFADRWDGWPRPSADAVDSEPGGGWER